MRTRGERERERKMIKEHCLIVAQKKERDTVHFSQFLVTVTI